MFSEIASVVFLIIVEFNNEYLDHNSDDFNTLAFSRKNARNISPLKLIFIMYVPFHKNLIILEKNLTGL